MDVLAAKLKERARDLGLSDAEVARRAGLSEPRYGHYVAGTRRPDYGTLLRLCDVLGTSPNELLGFSATDGNKPNSQRDRLLERLAVHARALSEADLALAVDIVKLMADRRPDGEAG